MVRNTKPCLNTIYSTMFLFYLQNRCLQIYQSFSIVLQIICKRLLNCCYYYYYLWNKCKLIHEVSVCACVCMCVHEYTQVKWRHVLCCCFGLSSVLFEQNLWTKMFQQWPSHLYLKSVSGNTPSLCYLFISKMMGVIWEICGYYF